MSITTASITTIATDTLAACTDVTTNNATTSLHGFLKKLDGTATHAMNGAGNWTAPGQIVTTVADAATITAVVATTDVVDVTLAADAHAIGAPTGPVDGARLRYRIRQGGAGSLTVTWNAVFKFTTTHAQPTLSTAIGKTDIIDFEYDSTLTKWRCVNIVKDD